MPGLSNLAQVAQNGLLAVWRARDGVPSSAEMLEAKKGQANMVGSGEISSRRRLRGLGTVGGEKIARNALKPLPCGIVVHPVIDGCVWLHR